MRTPVPILLYHSIAEDATPQYQRWAVCPEMFAAQMAYLQEYQYTPLNVTQFVRAISAGGVHLPPRPVVITFDDGLADFFTGAFPILQQYDFTATLYLTTGFIGRTGRWLRPEGEGDRPMLTWAQVAEISAGGIECGAHSLSHPQLDTLPRAAAAEEIRRSKAGLEQRLGRPVLTFAYPHGYYDSTIRRMVQEAGYTSACAVKHALSASTDDRFALARLMVTAGTDRAGFSDLLAGRGLPVAPARERLRTKGWRLARRTAGWWNRYIMKSGLVRSKEE